MRDLTKEELDLTKEVAFWALENCSNAIADHLDLVMVELNRLYKKLDGELNAKECPQCKEMTLHPDPPMNSLSRDNETMICDDCGTAEALEEYFSQ